MSELRYAVHFAPSAEDDLIRLTEFLLERVHSLEDLDRVDASVRALRQAVEQQLAAMPWSFRKAGAGNRTTRRELIVPTGSTGYVALYEIEPTQRVLVLAVRHQLEQDYH